jgi:Type III restriction enzyme, res subunit
VLVLFWILNFGFVSDFEIRISDFTLPLAQCPRNAEMQRPTEIGEQPKPLPRKLPRPHQAKAIEEVTLGFRDHERGQLIMACGTGKTLTALWIAEKVGSRRTLVLVPSLSLISQTLAEWSRNAALPFQYVTDPGPGTDADSPACQCRRVRRRLWSIQSQRLRGFSMHKA